MQRLLRVSQTRTGTLRVGRPLLLRGAAGRLAGRGLDEGGRKPAGSGWARLICPGPEERLRSAKSLPTVRREAAMSCKRHGIKDWPALPGAPSPSRKSGVPDLRMHSANRMFPICVTGKVGSPAQCGANDARLFGYDFSGFSFSGILTVRDLIKCRCCFTA